MFTHPIQHWISADGAAGSAFIDPKKKESLKDSVVLTPKQPGNAAGKLKTKPNLVKI